MSEANGNERETERRTVASLVVVIVIVIVSLPFPSILFAPRDNICLTRRVSACTATLHCYKPVHNAARRVGLYGARCIARERKKGRERERKRKMRHKRERERFRESLREKRTRERRPGNTGCRRMPVPCYSTNLEIQRDCRIHRD